MYAKVFSQIYDSSIVEKPDVRFTFMDFLILADKNGVVDMTHEAIARRTNRPIELIRATISELEADDFRSRTPDFNGARIKRLDDHRDWGWMIVNYDKFRQIASGEQRREKTLARVRKHRESSNLPSCNDLKRSVTLGNAGNAKHKYKQKHKQIEESLLFSVPGFAEEFGAFREHRVKLKAPMTDRAEELLLKTLSERPSQAVGALQKTILNGWKGVKWEWLDRDKTAIMRTPTSMPDDRPDDVIAASKADGERRARLSGEE